MAKKSTTDSVEITVSPGRTIKADKNYGSGATLTVSSDEAERLKTLGFAVASASFETSPQVAQEGAQITTELPSSVSASCEEVFSETSPQVAQEGVQITTEQPGSVSAA